MTSNQIRDKNFLRSTKSIEEIILNRRLKQQQSLSITDGPQLKVSSSLPRLHPSKTSNSTNQSMVLPSNTQEIERSYSISEVKQMMNESMKYCRVLQSRVQELETQLTYISRNQVTNPSRDYEVLLEPDPMSLSASGPRLSLETLENRDENRDQMRSSFDQSRGNMISMGKIRPNSSNKGNNNQNNINNTRLSTSNTNNTNISTANSTNTPFSNKIINELVYNIDDKIINLKEIFRRTDPIEERNTSAIIIQALIRGFLQRNRYQIYQKSLREYRWQRCRPVIWLLDILLANQSKLDAGFHLLKMNRIMRLLYTIFGKWSIIAKQNAPMRKGVRQAAEEKIANKRLTLLTQVFTALKSVLVGTMSRKYAIQKRKQMIQVIRKELSYQLMLRGELGIVPELEITKALHRKIIEEFILRKKNIVLTSKMKSWKQLITLAHQNMKKSYDYRFKRLVGRCFNAWSEFIYLVSIGLDRKRWPGPRKYEVRYNQKRVNNFTKIRCERMIFYAWKAYFEIQYTVKRKYQHKVASFMQLIFREWRRITSKQHILRVKTYENWLEYPKLLIQPVFVAWKEHVKGVKNRYFEHLRIANSYIRWKSRQRLLTILKVWRHQALFGRIDGLYTRQMLLKSLGEQKIFVNTLEKAMADQTMELEECKILVQTELDKRKDLEIEIARLQHENNKSKMKNHHYEQELLRLESVIESMIQLNPKQIEHILSLQPDFKFKMRNIALPEAMEAELLNRSTRNSADLSAEDVKNKGPKLSSDENVDQTTEENSEEMVDKNKNMNNDEAVSGLGRIEEGEGDEEEDKEHNKEDGEGTNPEVTKEGDNKSVESGLAFDLLDDSSVNSLNKAHPDQPSHQNSTTEATTKKERPLSSHSDLDNLGHGYSHLSIEDQRVLERAQWILTRYKQAIPIEHDNEPKEGDSFSPWKDTNDTVPPNNEGMIVNKTQSQLENEETRRAIEKAVLAVGGVDSPGRDSIGMNFSRKTSLLRASNPFVRNASFDPYDSNPMNRVKNGSFRGSFSRQSFGGGIPPEYIAQTSPMGNNNGPNIALNLTNINLNNNNQMMMNGMQGPIDVPGYGMYYADEELEDIVIAWARMLFTFLEFLDTGDITNLPPDEKRQWSKFLIEQSSAVNEIPLFPEDTDNIHHMLASSSSAASEIEAKPPVVTLNSNLHGEVSWREALLRLRTMFPGAGNFSGFGVGIESPLDTSLFQRLLQMRDDLHKVEEVQRIRYEKRFLYDQEITKLRTPALNLTTLINNGMMIPEETLPPTGTSTLLQPNKAPSSPSSPFRFNNFRVQHISSEDYMNTINTNDPPPLGTNIYAGNLKKLIDED